MTNYYTEDLAKFGFREISMLKDILVAWVEKGLPDNFYNSEVKPAMNMASGFVFLVNSDYQVAMLNGDVLEVYHNLPYCGAEGFLEDLIHDYDPDDLNKDDAEYIIDAAEASNHTLQNNWLILKNKL